MERITTLFWLTVTIVCFTGVFYDVSWEDGDIFPTFTDEFPEWSFGEKIKIMFVCGIAFIVGWIFYIAGSIRDFFKD